MQGWVRACVLGGDGEVHQVQVHVVEAQVVETVLHRLRHMAMVRVPQLGRGGGRAGMFVIRGWADDLRHALKGLLPECFKFPKRFAYRVCRNW